MPTTCTAAQPSLFDGMLPVHTGSSLLKTVPQNCQVLWMDGGCPTPHRPYCPKFLLWALSLLAVYTRVCFLTSVTSRKLPQQKRASFLCAGERIPAGHPFGSKDHTAPSVEWPAFWIQSLQGLCSHPFISNILEEQLLKISRAHCNFEGRTLWIRNPILHLLLYISVAEGMVGGNVHHYSQRNLWLLPCWLCSSQLRNAHHFVPALLFDHSVSLEVRCLWPTFILVSMQRKSRLIFYKWKKTLWINE